MGCQLCLSLTAHQTWLGWGGDSSDSQLLPCLQWIPGASRLGELPKASLGRSGWGKAAPAPQDPSPSGLWGSGVRPVVNWEETRMLNITIFIYSFTYSSWQFRGQAAGCLKCPGYLPGAWVRPPVFEASASLEGRLSLSFVPWERTKSLANKRTGTWVSFLFCTDLRYSFWCFIENILQQQCLVVTQSSWGINQSIPLQHLYQAIQGCLLPISVQ